MIMKKLEKYDFEKDFNKIGKSFKVWNKLKAKISIFNMIQSPNVSFTHS